MSKDVIKLDQLIRIAEDVPWETFEAMPDGRLLLKDGAQTMLPDKEDTNPLLWVFELRVGLHFGRPMQAIMSCGHFIRMRSTPMYENCTLGKLDPEHPEVCLYQYPMYPQNQGMVRTTSTWRPTPTQYGLAGYAPTVWPASNQMVTSTMGGGGGGGGAAGRIASGSGGSAGGLATATYPQGTLSRIAGALGVKI